MPQFLAEEVRFAANLISPELVAALARVPREKFLGPGPWQVAVPNLLTGGVQYVETPGADARSAARGRTAAAPDYGANGAESGQGLCQLHRLHHLTLDFVLLFQFGNHAEIFERCGVAFYFSAAG